MPQQYLAVYFHLSNKGSCCPKQVMTNESPSGQGSSVLLRVVAAFSCLPTCVTATGREPSEKGRKVSAGGEVGDIDGGDVGSELWEVHGTWRGMQNSCCWWMSREGSLRASGSPRRAVAQLGFRRRSLSATGLLCNLRQTIEPFCDSAYQPKILCALEGCFWDGNTVVRAA